MPEVIEKLRALGHDVLPAIQVMEPVRRPDGATIGFRHRPLRTLHGQTCPDFGDWR